MTREYLIAQLTETTQEILDEFPAVVTMPEEGSATEMNLILTLRSFFDTLIDNLNSSARSPDAP